jgi:PAT family beta-lactamase induction signal transducer AmpG
MAEFVSWHAAYFTMDALTGIGMVGTLLAPSPSESTEGRSLSFASAVIEPLRDLFRRKGLLLVPILLLVGLFRLPDFVSGVMANPLYIDLGFAKTDIANVSKLYGVWVGIAGAFAGGFALTRIGLWPTLLIGAVVASSSHLMLAWLALAGARLDLLTIAISVENFASGFAGSALIAYMSSLTSPGFAATQYALLSSLYALPGKFIGGFSGAVVDKWGYPTLFTATATIALPLVILCFVVRRDTLQTTDTVRALAAAAPDQNSAPARSAPSRA